MVPAEGSQFGPALIPRNLLILLKREKRQKHRIRPSEVHGGYTELRLAYRARPLGLGEFLLRKILANVFGLPKQCAMIADSANNGSVFGK